MEMEMGMGTGMGIVPIFLPSPATTPLAVQNVGAASATPPLHCAFIAILLAKGMNEEIAYGQ